MEEFSDNQAAEETLLQLSTEDATSFSTLIGALKGILAKVKKIPGGRDYELDICERIQILYHHLLEENAKLLRKEKR